MSQSSRKSSKRRKPSSRSHPETGTKDSSIYLGLLIIGAFVVLLVSLLTGGEHWGTIALGFAAAIAYLTNFYAIRAYLGKPLLNWQQALARLPLRCAGYGTKHGKPLEAAHKSERAKMMILMSIAASIGIIIGLSYLFVPEVMQG